jgi:alkylation response protein AidB-like acyl-CoA dehydrogenase
LDGIAPTTEAAETMTDTLSGSQKTSKTSPSRVKRRGRKTGVGLQPHKRTGIDITMALLAPIVGQDFLDKYGLRDPFNRGLRYGTKTLFATAGAASRQFKRVQNLRGGPTRLKSSGKDFYDLTPDDDQKMIVETLQEFAEEILRPAAADADAAATYPKDLIAKAAELGITAVNIPEDFDGIAAQRSSVTNVLVAEALAYGDMGLALPILAPGGVASALTHWGSADQQATYLKEFAGENVPQACVAIAEPQPLFDPTRLKTTAVRTPSGYRLDGVKSLVPAAADAELFIIGAQLNGKPALFIVESSAKGLTVKADPSMGIRAAALGRVELSGVSVPPSARLGEDDASADDYSEAIALSRLGWAALAVGTSHAVLDYVIPYVKEREAFGEPIARRQAVAFMCANIAIELDGLRLITWRGAARAEQGLTFSREAALAKRLGADKGMQIGLDGVQLLGGHGYTKEHPVERWYRDLRAIGVAEGVVVI